MQTLLVYLGLMLLFLPGISLNVAYLYSTRPYRWSTTQHHPSKR